MRVRVDPSSVVLWLSSNDTYNWSKRVGAAWPCSQLAGKRLVVEFDSNGLVDLSIEGRSGDCDVNELNAITSDYLRNEVPKSHPAYSVTVGQFAEAQHASC